MASVTARRGEAVALGALALLILALDVTPITNNDLFLHLKTGEIILRSGSVPRVDDYSALARGRPFVAHEWLAGVIFRLVQAAGGWNGLILFKTVVALGVAALLYRTARAAGAPPGAAVPALAFVMILAAARFFERPHIFTYLMTAAFLLLLARRAAGRRAPGWAFAALQVIWANLHGGFVLGPLLVLIAGAGSVLDETLRPGRSAARPPGRYREAISLFLLAILLVGCCLVNPYGPRLLEFPFQLTGSAFMGEIYEWLPPLVIVDWRAGSVTASPFLSTYMARYYLAWIVLGLLTYALAARRFRREGTAPPGGTFPALLFAAFLLLSLRMNRNVTDFALATFPGVAATLPASAAPLFARAAGPDRPGGGRRTLPLVAAGLAALAIWFLVAGYAYGPSLRRRPGLGLGRNIPVGAADYLAAIRMRGGVFNTYASGAYLIYRLYPEVRVAMDSRNDVYGEDLYRQYTRALTDADSLEEMLRRLDAGAIVLEWPNAGMMTAAAAVHRLKGWTPAYFDDVTVVYLGTGGPWAAAAARDGYALLDPALYRGGAVRPDNAARVLQEAERALARRRSYIARVMRIDALFSLGRDGEALGDERRILDEDPPLFHIYTHLGWIRLARGEREAAVQRFRRALALQPDSQVARQGLALAQGQRGP